MARITITYEEWMMGTKVSGKFRSKLLRQVDQALQKYDGSKDATWKLCRSFQAWQASKGLVGDDAAWKTNPRNHSEMISKLQQALFPPNRINDNPNDLEEIKILPEFPGFGIRYDESTNPFFRAILLENLTKLNTVRTGRTLLRVIAQASPIFRADFPLAVNVVCQPLGQAFSVTQSGQKVKHGEVMLRSKAANHNPTSDVRDCSFYRSGKGSLNAAVSPTQAEEGGSVCVMTFTAAQVLTSKGEIAYPFIVLGHELIHSYHCLYGIRHPKDEERWTTGVGEFEGEPMSENGLRRDFKLPLRENY